MRFVYINHRKENLDLDMVKPVVNNIGCIKPNSGGLWSAPYTPEQEYISKWHEFKAQDWDEEYYGLYEEAHLATSFKLNADSRILTINNYSDLADAMAKYFTIVVEEYSVFVEDPFPYGTYYNYERLKIVHALDFEAIAKDYDAIHLTEDGEIATRSPLGKTLSLSGWDIESMFILNSECIDEDSIQEIEIPRTSCCFVS